ncbi:hypothetical protein HWV62_26582 [Athelia sp. TMB]|nr:hypothetical protein HWV62_26582 [Athelia sp. TMB]
MREIAARPGVADLMLPTLPVELWAYIVKLSSYSVCLKISRVSRLHRVLALPAIFKSLNIAESWVTPLHGESESDLEAKRTREYLRLDEFLQKVATGDIQINRFLRRLSVRPVIKHPAWAPVNAPISSVNSSSALGGPVSAETYPNLRDRLSDVIFNTSSLVTFRWNSRIVPFPNELGQALVLGAPQLQCLDIRAPGFEHDLEFSPLTQLQQVTIILTTGVCDAAQLRSMGALLQLSSITELQIPTAVPDSVLARGLNTNLIQPTLRHLRVQVTPSTLLLNMQHLHSLHLQGSGNPLQVLWLGGRVMSALRFLTLIFVPLQAGPSDYAFLTITVLGETVQALERLKIADLSGILPLSGTPPLNIPIFACFHRLAHLRVFAMAVKSMEWNHAKDLVEHLPETVSTVSLRIGNMSEEPEVYFQLFLPLRERLRALDIHCLTRAENASDKRDDTYAQREASARTAAEEVLLHFTKLDAIGTEGYFFEVPRLHGARVPGPLPLLPLRWRESVFDATDAEWAFESALDAE